jgi:hypothetical protein
LKKAGVLWMRRKEDTDWVRHYVVASGHSLEWLAMEGKLVRGRCSIIIISCRCLVCVRTHRLVVIVVWIVCV